MRFSSWTIAIVVFRVLYIMNTGSADPVWRAEWVESAELVGSITIVVRKTCTWRAGPETSCVRQPAGPCGRAQRECSSRRGVSAVRSVRRAWRMRQANKNTPTSRPLKSSQMPPVESMTPIGDSARGTVRSLGQDMDMAFRRSGVVLKAVKPRSVFRPTVCITDMSACTTPSNPAVFWLRSYTTTYALRLCPWRSRG